MGPVSGVEGEIVVEGIWPDSVLAASLVVLDELSLDSLEKTLISYGDPVLQGDTAASYFIQLRPGGYYLVSVGITIEPGVFFANMDSVLAAPQLPVIPLGDNPQDFVTPILIQDQMVSREDVIITFQ